MDKGSFGVHQIEFVIQPSPSFIDSRGIRQATNGTHNFGLVSARHDGRWLIVDANLRKEKLGIDLAMHNAIQLTLNPVGHQSTNCTCRFALISAMAPLTSLGTCRRLKLLICQLFVYIKTIFVSFVSCLFHLSVICLLYQLYV